MKTAYKWFNIFLNVLVAGVLGTAVVIFVLLYNSYNFPPVFGATMGAGAIMGAVVEYVLLVYLFFGLLYIITGISLLIINWKLKNKQRFNFGKKMLLNGVLKSIFALFLFFCFSLALSFFPLSTPVGPCGAALCLPKNSGLDSSTSGFPVNDLVIIDRKAVAPQIKDEGWLCTFTLQNNNATMSAVNIIFDNNAVNSTSDDVISPGQSKVITVYPGSNSQTACTTISISSAQFVSPSPSPGSNQ